jgi:5-formyltetrahydrofolate cyclo-ligase
MRKALRARRRNIRGAARQAVALQIARLVASRHWLRPGRRIGLYLPLPDELDCREVIDLARRRGCTVAFPRIVDQRHARMRFVLPDRPLSRGAFGILEPRGQRALRALELDLVFVPLVGFDATGRRIGMGKGFYDRHFAHRLRLQRWRRPLLIGLAYECQRVPALHPSAHDVPLDFIVTESTVLKTGGRP